MVEKRAVDADALHMDIREVMPERVTCQEVPVASLLKEKVAEGASVKALADALARQDVKVGKRKSFFDTGRLPERKPARTRATESFRPNQNNNRRNESMPFRLWIRKIRTNATGGNPLKRAVAGTDVDHAIIGASPSCCPLTHGVSSKLSRCVTVIPLLTATLLVGTAGCSFRPAELSTIDIVQPGKVLVDHETRREKLKGGELCPIWETALPETGPPPVVGVEAPSGYGIDWRFAGPRDQMMELGAACLKLGGKPCRIIVDTMVSWSQAGAAIVESSGDNSRFWNDSITVNLDVVRPFVGAYAIARSSVAVAQEEDDRIREWIETVLWRSRNLLRGVDRKGRNYAAHNHAVASAAAHMAYGAMWGDSTAFGHGVDQWFITLGDMRRDGSLPIETRRGARALFYTGRVLSGLASIAEMARTQGIDLYSSGPSDGKTIHKAVAFMLDALENNDAVFPYARENFASSGDWRQQDLGNPGSTLGWVIPYVARFPDHANVRRLRSLEIDKRIPAQDVLDYVLAPDSAVMGHWIGCRSDCLYGAPQAGQRSPRGGSGG